MGERAQLGSEWRADELDLLEKQLFSATPTNCDRAGARTWRRRRRPRFRDAATQHRSIGVRYVLLVSKYYVVFRSNVLIEFRSCA